MALLSPVTLLGLTGGFIASAVFTLLMHTATPEFILPTNAVWRRYGGPFGSRVQTIGAGFSHVLVGTLSGGLFPWLVSSLIDLPDAYLTTIPQSLTAGLAFGLSLYALARSVELFGVIDLAESEQSRHLFEYHVLYGLGLGCWFGVTNLFGYPLLCTGASSVCSIV